ncbi:N-acetyltransferase [Oscillatoria sp. FACHB-1406]|uniref:GNAT family N-acetyltransferase n=1 Tax=Oscillatoria sp. FACHB-1406 TaxID=2692846 RepID=UPI001688E09D|nr:N-acetyltransferase [Oscillatoria sp. FACHB-1406]MBD2580595.1 N-acetyltransferase [Oscillatoria sp. FACHB-1406]
MEILLEQPQDFNEIRKVNIAAFGRENEADLVERLRTTTSTLSFVAVESNCIVGHIFYSPVEIEGECAPDCLMLGLAPMAVLPEYQRQGIGTMLLRKSLEEIARSPYRGIVVLGYPEYYPRFGFVTAREKGLQCEYDVPDEVFMVLELENGALEGCRGTVKYHPEFSSVS